jgi:hypothetical protein
MSLTLELWSELIKERHRTGLSFSVLEISMSWVRVFGGQELAEESACLRRICGAEDFPQGG